MTDERIVCRKLADGGVEYLKTVDELLECVSLTQSELEESRSRVAWEIERRLPSLIRGATIAALSPSIQKDAKDYFRRKHVRWHDAENLASSVVTNILNVLFGRPPWGNVWAWVRQIQAHAFADYCEAMERERTFRRLQARGPVARSCENRALDSIIFEEWLARLPPTPQKIIKLLRDGAKPSEVADALEMRIDEVERIIQEIDGPDGESPRPKRPRRKRLS